MANYIETAAVIQKNLDTASTVGLSTGWMDKNAGKVKYSGGREIKIPKVDMDGMADYDRANGFVEGDVTLEYETRTMTQDRGRGFTIDEADVDESNYALEISSVMGEFQREKVIPEIDAYRISTIATNVIGASEAGMTVYGYVPGTAGTSALRKAYEAIKAVRDQGYDGIVALQASSNFVLELKLELAAKLQFMEVVKGGITIKVPAIDGNPIFETVSNRMVSAITTLDGTSEDQKVGGWKKAESALDIELIATPMVGPMAVNKLDKFRIFDPKTYQKAAAWHADYRRYHDLWMTEKRIKQTHITFSSAKPA
ncbi:MAG: hypothetical protein J6L69_10335 [Lachnospiraceae bacterium]|nr:hypothetical protein [Lachnospiraceae bacterium]